IVSDNTGKWRSQISARQRALFEGVAGDLLSSLGYETDGRLARAPSRRRRLLARADSSLRLSLRRLNSRNVSPRTFLIVREARLRHRLRGLRPRQRRLPRDHEALNSEGASQ